METIIKRVYWFNTMSGSIGIVTIDNGFETKSYIKSIEGISENDDIIDIYKNGAKFPTKATEHLVGYDINKTVQELS